jgi:hypothetical protein
MTKTKINPYWTEAFPKMDLDGQIPRKRQIDAVCSIIRGSSQMIRDAWILSATPQGIDHWVKVYLGHAKLDQNDIEFASEYLRYLVGNTLKMYKDEAAKLRDLIK